jgi:hypothetical protein
MTRSCRAPRRRPIGRGKGTPRRLTPQSRLLALQNVPSLVPRHRALALPPGRRRIPAVSLPRRRLANLAPNRLPLPLVPKPASSTLTQSPLSPS